MRAVYWLKLSAIMWIHNIFSLKLLCSCADNSLSDQQTSSSALIVTEDDKEHWEIDDILDLKQYCEWVQYKVK